MQIAKKYLLLSIFLLSSFAHAQDSETEPEILPPPYIDAPPSTSTGNVRMTWPKVTGATRYAVYESINGGLYNLAQFTPARVYTATDLPDGHHFFIVSACNLIDCATFSEVSRVDSGPCHLLNEVLVARTLVTRGNVCFEVAAKSTFPEGLRIRGTNTAETPTFVLARGQSIILGSGGILGGMNVPSTVTGEKFTTSVFPPTVAQTRVRLILSHSPSDTDQYGLLAVYDPNAYTFDFLRF